MVGAAAFEAGLRDLGYRPVAIPAAPSQLYFDYQAETGVFAGKAVRLGLIVPPDFPMTPPCALHVSPGIHAMVYGGAHPTGGIHVCGLYGFNPPDPANWQCWSRPFPGWQSSKKTVAAYMSFVWRLWDTQ